MLLNKSLIPKELKEHKWAEVPSEAQDRLRRSLSYWDFNIWDCSDAEMAESVLMIFEKATQQEGAREFAIEREQLICFIQQIRVMYNDTNPYHNFRHACDVTQSVYVMLVLCGQIPPLCEPDTAERMEQVPDLKTCKSFLSGDMVLALLIAAFGHDTAHPGISNAFLCTTKAPLGTIYNERSPLENFHVLCTTQALERYWNSAYEGLRDLIRDSILATDMALHYEYCVKLAQCIAEVQASGTSELTQDQSWLMCSMILKCADISNIAREYNVSQKWSEALLRESLHQRLIEESMRIPVTPMCGATNEIQSDAQIKFIDAVGLPLYAQVAIIMPPISRLVKCIELTRSTWMREHPGHVMSADEEHFVQPTRPPRSAKSGPPVCSLSSPPLTSASVETQESAEPIPNGAATTTVPGHAVDHQPKQFPFKKLTTFWKRRMSRYESQ